METILSSPSVSPLLNPKPSSPKAHFSSSLPHKSSSLFSTKSIVTSTLKKQTFQSLKPLSSTPTSWFSHAQQGLAALALSLALNFSPLVYSGNALASEFDVLNEGPPKESYVIDDAGVLSRVTKSDLKRLLSDLESRKNLKINFITVRKLTSKADAFEYADQVLEKWYPSIEEGNNKGIVVLVTSQKEGAVTGGPAFVQAVGENILDATVSENLPGNFSHLVMILIVESRLRWFGHVWRRPMDSIVRRVDQMGENLVARGKGRPRKTISETIKNDFEVNGFTLNMIHDRPLWRRLIHIVDFT